MFARHFLVLEAPCVSFEIWLHAGCDLQRVPSRNSAESPVIHDTFWRLGAGKLRGSCVFQCPENSLILNTVTHMSANSLTHVRTHFNVSCGKWSFQSTSLRLASPSKLVVVPRGWEKETKQAYI